MHVIEPSWEKVLTHELSKPYFKELTAWVHTAYSQRDYVVYPPRELIFNALTLCPFEMVKVVILGQDPYHGRGQAHGLAFSVTEQTPIPPSLRNIYVEIQRDVGTPIPTSGDLTRLARQGVLLLNTTLTVSAGTAGSHQGMGWETFTDAIIRTISDNKSHVVFLLWGKRAQAKRGLIDSTKHYILTAPHPSPLSAYTGFLGCGHFSKTNQYLTQTHQTPIVW